MNPLKRLTPKARKSFTPRTSKRANDANSPQKEFSDFVKQTLRSVSSRKYAVHFRRPVDTVQLNIPDYNKIVRDPMDLSTMLRKWQTKKYANVDELFNDVELMANNCLLYNGESSEIYRQCGKVVEYITERLKAKKAEIAHKMHEMVQNDSAIIQSSYGYDVDVKPPKELMDMSFFLSNSESATVKQEKDSDLKPDTTVVTPGIKRQQRVISSRTTRHIKTEPSTDTAQDSYSVSCLRTELLHGSVSSILEDLATMFPGSVHDLRQIHKRMKFNGYTLFGHLFQDLMAVASKCSSMDETDRFKCEVRNLWVCRIPRFPMRSFRILRELSSKVKFVNELCHSMQHLGRRLAKSVYDLEEPDEAMVDTASLYIQLVDDLSSHSDAINSGLVANSWMNEHGLNNVKLTEEDEVECLTPAQIAEIEKILSTHSADADKMFHLLTAAGANFRVTNWDELDFVGKQHLIRGYELIIAKYRANPAASVLKSFAD